MPVNEEMQADALQEIWLALIQQRRKSPATNAGISIDDFITLVRQKVEQVQKSTVRWYAVTVPPEAVPEAVGTDLDNPLEVVAQGEDSRLQASVRESALLRLRGAMAAWPKPEVMPGVVTSGVSDEEPKDRHVTESARRLRDLLDVTGWSHGEVCGYLHISKNRLREILYRGSRLSDSESDRIIDMLQAGQDARQWDWPRLIEDGCRATGKDSVAFRKHLAGIMGVDSRTIYRWTKGGFGAKRGIQIALEVRSRGWKR